MIKHVVWDWNGTLLDDVDGCVATINTLLRDRGMHEIGRDHYRERFGFPVRNFYIELGFDMEREDFDRVSATFIARYRERSHTMALHGGAQETLASLRARGVRQHVVSAMEERMLHEMLAHHSIAPHLHHVRGLNHVNATSKVELGVALVAELGCNSDEILFIGDTLHDHETANAMGCRCALFVGGHQTATRLERARVDLIESLADVERIIDRA